MASADMNRLLDHARIRLPGALDAAMQLEFFSVVDEFLQRTNLWYEDITFTVNPSTDSYLENPAAYTFTLTPTQGTIVRLMGVIDGRGAVQPATMPTLEALVLSYLPSEVSTYTARVSLSVTDPVTSEGNPDFPEWILGRYGSDLLEGVLGRMMSQIAKPYSAPQMAAVHLRNFSKATNQAKVEAMHQNLYRGQSWRFPQTYSSRNQRL